MCGSGFSLHLLCSHGRVLERSRSDEHVHSTVRQRRLDLSNRGHRQGFPVGMGDLIALPPSGQVVLCHFSNMFYPPFKSVDNQRLWSHGFEYICGLLHISRFVTTLAKQTDESCGRVSEPVAVYE